MFQSKVGEFFDHLADKYRSYNLQTLFRKFVDKVDSEPSLQQILTLQSVPSTTLELLEQTPWEFMS